MNSVVTKVNFVVTEMVGYEHKSVATSVFMFRQRFNMGLSQGRILVATKKNLS